MGEKSRESGQAAVETALVMPLMLFVVLGVLQLGLISHARVMGKYAAYRAARVGALNHANVDAMVNAALLHLSPVLVGSNDVIMPTGDSGELLAKFAAFQIDNQISVPGGQVRVVICGPVRSEVMGGGSSPLTPARADQRSLHGIGSANEVDFDDPRLFNDDGQNHRRAMAVRSFNRTRLRIQLQLLYRMPIPFANWIMTHLYIGTHLPEVLRMGTDDVNFTTGRSGAGSSQVNRVRAAALAGIYTLPINVNYAMRMQSNFFTTRHPLPTSNQCVHYKP